MTEPTPSGPKGPPPKRSPSYPYISLREAVAKIRVVREKQHHHPTTAEVIASLWEYSPKSSGGRQTVAALRAFGLLEPVGDGQLKVSNSAAKILLSEGDSQEQLALLREAALKPRLHAKLWERFGAKLPAPQSLRITLELEEGFNANSVEDFLREYEDTIAFAKVAEPGIMPPVEEGKIEAPSGGAMQTSETPTSPFSPKPAPQLLNPPHGEPSRHILALSVPFHGTSLTVRIEVLGQMLKKEHLARVRKYLELAEDDLEAGGKGFPTPVQSDE
jgi:hypothetical protein